MAESLDVAAPDGKPSPWKKTPTPNLVRYIPSGTYYLRGRFGGHPYRESLHTADYRTARGKLEERLGKLRAKQRQGGKEAPETLAAALGQVRSLVAADPALKRGTLASYLDSLDRMKPGAPCAVPPGPIHQITSGQMSAWWAQVAARYAPQQANHLLMFCRRAFKLARRSNPHILDLTEELNRVPIPRTRLELPTHAEFASVVASIRAQWQSPHHEEAANWVEFMAFSGARPKEIDEIEWRDVREDVIEIWGGEDRTKNGEMRMVPIIPPMRALLARMRGDTLRAGKLFTIGKPRDALRAACKRLKLPHQRIYNLRHLFATTCMEAGVDVPTFAGWLGHKDGGALAMRTYVQSRDDHRNAMAAKVTFA